MTFKVNYQVNENTTYVDETLALKIKQSVVRISRIWYLKGINTYLGRDLWKFFHESPMRSVYCVLETVIYVCIVEFQTLITTSKFLFH